MRQLVISGDSWEVRQQRRLLDEGHKEYRLLFAYDSSHTFEFMDAVTSILFDDSAWELLLSRTERRQLQGCLEGLRLGAMGHQLVLLRNRRPPYSTLASLRVRELCAQLAACPKCTLDSYTQNLLQYYGGRCDSDAAMAELQTLLELGETDTVSTERLHSVNNLKTLHRHLTHKMDLPTLDAYYIGRQTRDHTPEGQPKPCRKRGAALQEPKVERRRGGGGAWRAFLHVRARGQRCTPELWGEMSEQFSRLSDEQLAHFKELGKIGTQLHRRAHRAFERGPRRRRDEELPPHAGTTSLQLVVAPGGEARPALEGGLQNPGDGDGILHQRAKRVLQSERLRARREQESEEADSNRVRQHSVEHLDAQRDAWGLDATEGVSTLVLGVGPTIRWQAPEALSPGVVGAVIGARSLEHICEE